MNYREKLENRLQLDYFSDSYKKFEADFYRFSALKTPLTFLTDDILLEMAESMCNYFRLNKENAVDHQDHYYIFKVETDPQNRLIRKYIYQRTSIIPPQKSDSCK